MARRQILIDCNTGPDASLALLCALALPGMDVKGVSSVFGAFPMEAALRNTGRVLALSGRGDVPRCRGSKSPLLAPRLPFRDDWEPYGLPEPLVEPSEDEAADFLWRLAGENPGAALLALGPLTNVARMLLAHPDAAKRLGGIIVGGGAHAWGNAAPKAEFNILSDPHAAHIVFESHLPILMVGLDAASECEALPDGFARSLAGPSKDFAAMALGAASEHCAKPCCSGGACLQAVTAALCAACPQAFDLAGCHIDIELKGRLTFGQTVCDFTGVSKKQPNAKIAMHIKEQPFRRLLFDTLASV